MKILVANSNPVHEELVARLAEEYNAVSVTTPQELKAITTETVFDYIVFPHWSYIIPASIYERQECVLFHMTDLPYGRGGSPLQNLIVRGHERTRLSAIRVGKGLDTGPVYAQADLSLLGTAREIFMRSARIMYELIVHILDHRPQPSAQVGEPTVFKRRTPSESDLSDLSNLPEVFNYIRMLDADGYPLAFVETDFLRFEFSRASRHAQSIIADVRITKK